MSSTDRWIAEKTAGTIFPERASGVLHGLSENWPGDAPPLREVLERFPLGEEALLHLLSVSSICGARLTSEPEILLWLANPEVCQAERRPGRMLADLRRLAPADISENNFEALRRWKGREMTRIALREVAEVAAIEETTTELSQLAEICLQQVFQYWDASSRARLGSPAADFAVLGLGKLGGRELNHSSDVDLVFLYSEEGQLSLNLSYHEWFNRLGGRIVDTFSATTSAGALFRIDLRLRPEGSAGPLARSLESMENYYAGFGETWEQLALIRARGVCGSEELAYEFLRQHQPFIYPRSPTPNLLDDIAAIKRRIERDIGHEEVERNVKLGAGGIREIEFLVQALQLIHGARNAFLQEPSTLKTLRALAQLDLMPKSEVASLDMAYRFLRRVEHRLQIEAEQQTHTVPDAAEPLDRLARSLGYSSGEELTKELHQQMGNVRAIFQKNISAPSSSGGQASVSLDFFHDKTRATKLLTDLEQGPARFHVAPRTRQVFRKLRPLLLAQLSKTADPDGTLNQIVRFVEAYGLRSLLFELLVVNPRLLELLTRLFDASRHAGELLVRRPQLLEEITRPGTLDQGMTVAAHLKRLEGIGATPDSLDLVRAYRHTPWLRIVLRDVLGLADFQNIVAELTAHLESILVFIHRLIAREAGLTIIALGKFGGRELTYGADLDVVFVGENNRAAQKIVIAMGQRTAEGTLAPLDVRLRPDGEKGPLVCRLTTYESYYTRRAHLWEIQALTRARAVCGPRQDEFMEMIRPIWRRAGQEPDLFERVDSMAARIRRDRSSGSDARDFKTGMGGMVEAEFLVQALQMKNDIWNPNWSEAVAALRDQGLLATEEATSLTSSYEFLRRCETTLRLREKKSVSSWPAADFEQRRLAVLLGYRDVAVFGRRYEEARRTIHSVYARYFQQRDAVTGR